jgi:hypothetical protein
MNDFKDPSSFENENVFCCCEKQRCVSEREGGKERGEMNE